MSDECTVLVALEDLATSGVVAAGAAQFAMEQDATRIILLHVLGNHFVANGLAGIVGAVAPSAEDPDEGSSILAGAEMTLQAEYSAVQKTPPQVVRQLVRGGPGSTIAQAAANLGATAIVVGARRPHALGRLTHADVVAYLREHTQLPIHVVALQAETPR